MIVQDLGRHFAIAGRMEAERIVIDEPDFWNVISLIGPGDRMFPLHKGAKSLHTESFLDVEDYASPHTARPHHLERIFKFVDGLSYTEPLLIHCQQGLGRSPAVALGIIARSLYMDGEEKAVSMAIDIVYSLREIAAPNLLVVQLAFQQFLPSQEVEAAVDMVKQEERFIRNRFQRG